MVFEYKLDRIVSYAKINKTSVIVCSLSGGVFVICWQCGYKAVNVLQGEGCGRGVRPWLLNMFDVLP